MPPDDHEDTGKDSGDGEAGTTNLNKNQLEAPVTATVWIVSEKKRLEDGTLLWSTWLQAVNTGKADQISVRCPV